MTTVQMSEDQKQQAFLSAYNEANILADAVKRGLLDLRYRPGYSWSKIATMQQARHLLMNLQTFLDEANADAA